VRRRPGNRDGSTANPACGEHNFDTNQRKACLLQPRLALVADPFLIDAGMYKRLVSLWASDERTRWMIKGSCCIRTKINAPMGNIPRRSIHARLATLGAASA
jgi:hypothetical protein